MNPEASPRRRFFHVIKKRCNNLCYSAPGDSLKIEKKIDRRFLAGLKKNAYNYLDKLPGQGHLRSLFSYL